MFRFEMNCTYITISIKELYNLSLIHSITGVCVCVCVTWSVYKLPWHWPNHREQLVVLYLAWGHFDTWTGGDGDRTCYFGKTHSTCWATAAKFKQQSYRVGNINYHLHGLKKWTLLLEMKHEPCSLKSVTCLLDTKPIISLSAKSHQKMIQ